MRQNRPKGDFNAFYRIHHHKPQFTVEVITAVHLQLVQDDGEIVKTNKNTGTLPAEWADFAWKVLAAQNQRLLKDCAQLATPEENLAELNAQALCFW